MSHPAVGHIGQTAEQQELAELREEITRLQDELRQTQLGASTRIAKLEKLVPDEVNRLANHIQGLPQREEMDAVAAKVTKQETEIIALRRQVGDVEYIASNR